MRNGTGRCQRLDALQTRSPLVGEVSYRGWLRRWLPLILTQQYLWTYAVAAATSRWRIYPQSRIIWGCFHKVHAFPDPLLRLLVSAEVLFNVVIVNWLAGVNIMFWSYFFFAINYWLIRALLST